MDGYLVEIKRIKNYVDCSTFSSEDLKCLKCGKLIQLWFNGGELDMVECCGMRYVTEHVQIDLVIYEDE